MTDHPSFPIDRTPTAGEQNTTDPEWIARLFHETYERLAPEFGYHTREESAKPWGDVPLMNRALMTATAAHVAAVVRASGTSAELANLRAELEAIRATIQPMTTVAAAWLDTRLNDALNGKP